MSPFLCITIQILNTWYYVLISLQALNLIEYSDITPYQFYVILSVIITLILFPFYAYLFSFFYCNFCFHFLAKTIFVLYHYLIPFPHLCLYFYFHSLPCFRFFTYLRYILIKMPLISSK